MPDFINTIETLGDYVVFDSIVNRTITEFKDGRVSFIGKGAFNECTNLVTIDLPNVQSVSLMTFTNCKALTNVNMPLLTEVGEQMFRGCENLKSISLPSMSGTTGYLAFEGCSTLEKIDIPLATEVDVYSFQGCIDLLRIDLPSVKTIRTGGLQCNNLIAVILRYDGICTLENTNAFGTAIHNKRGYIYVPSALIDSYKSATNWNNFASQFRALEDYTVDGTITGALDETKI